MAHGADSRLAARRAWVPVRIFSALKSSIFVVRSCKVTGFVVVFQCRALPSIQCFSVLREYSIQLLCQNLKAEFLTVDRYL